MMNFCCFQCHVVIDVFAIPYHLNCYFFCQQGKSSEPSPTTVIQKHGLQSLGKIASARRVPPPALLPSLRAENSGNDPTVNLVPTGGQGWGSNNNAGSPALDNTQQMTPQLNNVNEDTSRKTELIGSGEKIQHSGVKEETKAIVNGVQKSASGLQPSSTSYNNPPQHKYGSQENSSKGTSVHPPLLTSINNTTPILAPGGSLPSAQVSKRITTTPGLSGPVSASRTSPPTDERSKAGGDRRNGGNTNSGEGGGAGANGGQAPAAANPPPTKGWNTVPKSGPPKNIPSTNSSSSGPLTLADVIAGGPQPAPFSQKEFPKLGTSGTGGGSGTQSTISNSSQESGQRYGPGPSLRPQTGGDFGSNRSSGSQQGNSRDSTVNLNIQPTNASSTNSSSKPTASFRGIMPDYMGGNDVANFPSFPYRSNHSSRGNNSYHRKSDRDHYNVNPDPECTPLPIIKKEELEQFKEVAAPSWAASSSEIDFNKKLNFSEDESTVDEDVSSSSGRSQRMHDKWNKKGKDNGLSVNSRTQYDRNTPSPMDTKHSSEEGIKQQDGCSYSSDKASSGQRGVSKDNGGRSYGGSRWSESDKSPQPLLNNPPALLPCPPQSMRQFPQSSSSSYTSSREGPPGGSDVVVVQQVLNKAIIREQEEHKRYEEKMSINSYDDRKKADDESSANYDAVERDERGPLPGGRGRSAGSYVLQLIKLIA